MRMAGTAHCTRGSLPQSFPNLLADTRKSLLTGHQEKGRLKNVLFHLRTVGIGIRALPEVEHAPLQSTCVTNGSGKLLLLFGTLSCKSHNWHF